MKPSSVGSDSHRQPSLSSFSRHSRSSSDPINSKFQRLLQLAPALLSALKEMVGSITSAGTSMPNK